MKFICSQCAACCKSIGMLDGDRYGLPVKKDGSCAHLVGNLCSIHEDRPDICRTEMMNHKKPNQTRKDYYIQSTKACHLLIDLHGLDESYKVDISEYDSMDDEE